MDSLEITDSVDGDVTVLTLKGQATIAAVNTLERQLMGLAASRPKLTVFDMAGVDAISSLAMGTIVAYHQGVQRRGGVVVLAAVPAPVKMAFDVAKLDTLLTFANTVDDAKGHLPGE